ncbi:MAG: hypothetical protein AAFZ92_01790 [Pseudomonadota bacterium]
MKTFFSSCNVACILGSCLLVGAVFVQAGPLEQEQAKRIHERLTGVIPSTQVNPSNDNFVEPRQFPDAFSVLTAMEAELDGTDVNNDGLSGGVGAAYIAMNHKAFYGATIKNWVAPWTNRDQDVFVPFNDYIATVIGYIKEERDFRGILHEDQIGVSTHGGVPAYSTIFTPDTDDTIEDHYEYLENNGLVHTVELQTQSSVTGMPMTATAGVMTSHAAGRAFFVDGTNRAMFRFTLLNHMCRDLEQVQDNTRAPDRIRQDVSRSPGGDSRVFLNNCISCHSGMDPLAQAFAYYDYDNDELDADGNARTPSFRVTYNDVGQLDPVTGTRVDKKHLINATTFPQGYVTTNENWVNYWREGPNSLLGWDNTLPESASGANTMGRELAHSQAFAQCQVEKVFKNVCLRDPINATDLAQLQTLTTSFGVNSYNLKRVFAETADYCKGG